MLRANSLKSQLIAGVTVGLLSSVTMSHIVAGQVKMNGGTDPQLGRASQNPLQVRPATIVIDPKTQTAVVTIVNTSKDTAYGKPMLAFAAPRQQTNHPLMVGLVAGDSAIADSLRQDSLRTDSLSEHWSLVSWVKGLPQIVQVAPHETKTLTLHFDVPDALQHGDYSAHLIVYRMTRMTMSMGLSMGGAINSGKPMKAEGSGWNRSFIDPAVARLVYHADGTKTAH